MWHAQDSKKTQIPNKSVEISANVSLSTFLQAMAVVEICFDTGGGLTLLWEHL